MIFILSFWYVWMLLIGIILMELSTHKIAGFFTEKAVSIILSRLDPKKYKVINNIIIRSWDETTKIDYVVVSTFGIFVIETKSYPGWISGNEDDDLWKLKQVIYKRKEQLRNPIKQNLGHITAIKEYLSDCSDLRYISIIVYTTRATLKVKARTDVIYSFRLAKTIMKYNTKCLSDEVVDQVYNQLRSLSTNAKDYRKGHVTALNSRYADNSRRL
jgi:hypothetical protein